MNILQIIENDNLTEFQSFLNSNPDFDLNTQTIGQIKNYASETKYHPSISYDNVNCLKYAVHCESDKIIYFLLNNPNTNPNLIESGWPIISMAISKFRFDYANEIIKHPQFILYRPAHLGTIRYGCLTNCKEKEMISDDIIRQHSEYVKNYYNLLPYFEFLLTQGQSIEIITTNEKYFKVFQQQLKKYNLSISDFFSEPKQKYDLIDRTFDNYFNTSKYLLHNIPDEFYSSLLESYKEYSSDRLLSFFMKENREFEEFEFLYNKAPDFFNEIFKDEKVLFSYLSLNEILFLSKKGINIFTFDECKKKLFKSQEKEISGFLFLLKHFKNPSTDTEKELVSYFLKNNLDDIITSIQKDNQNLNDYPLINQAILNTKLKEGQKNKFKI